MIENTLCNVCDHPTSIDQASDIKEVFSNVLEFKDHSFTVWRCNHCGSLHSKEGVDLAPYYEGYPMTKLKRNFFIDRAYARRMNYLLKLGVKPQNTVLEYGCGKGQFVSFLLQKGFTHVQGFDPYVAEFSNPDILQEKYDVVFSQDVIEHVDDPKALIEEFYALLVDDGVCLIGTPNAEEISLRDGDSPELHQPYHRHILSEKALIALLKEEGFAVQFVSNRSYNDTFWPGVNNRFLWSYMKRAGGYVDYVVEDPKPGIVMKSLSLQVFMFIGYFLRYPGYMTIGARRTQPNHST
jgi:SAM-dependent methyltransferase